MPFEQEPWGNTTTPGTSIEKMNLWAYLLSPGPLQRTHSSWPPDALVPAEREGKNQEDSLPSRDYIILGELYHKREIRAERLVSTEFLSHPVDTCPKSREAVGALQIFTWLHGNRAVLFKRKGTCPALHSLHTHKKGHILFCDYLSMWRSHPFNFQIIELSRVWTSNGDDIRFAFTCEVAVTRPWSSDSSSCSQKWEPKHGTLSLTCCISPTDKLRTPWWPRW